MTARKSMKDRQPCACRVCSCTSSAYEAEDPCPSCRDGYHRPSVGLQRHLLAGLDEWIRMMPKSYGSSGLTDKQLAQTAEAWEAWHATQSCEWRQRAAA